MGKLRGVIRLGDSTGHGVNPIIEGEPTFLDQGKAVALNGHPGACNKRSFIASSTQNENQFSLLLQ
ncbi:MULTISPECIES: hypothetical protein [unclassified Gilliamella]|uniref:hypothetical protein n=1 Tax=unclassified Gilliamella TaxID=2685620 RepID=UPI002269F043|nr:MULTISPECIES: hypothetical protein [unclassified Gilliamella]MCX8641264.1 hypothetical protein [Gilliamella sp. B3835]MCX8706977.1 hypothetical protein [Gilliamella sp. B3783]MCX8709808.1 hypothetical protein [Gilliamella sp. B3780]MCX8714153.1 hypothetical protein [Gilliamella sp. B3781]MCX8715960.1 hypothetical protein [Gilliamella sp. B3784]